MSRRKVLLIVVALAIWGVAGTAGYRSWQRVQKQLAASEVCEALEARRYEEALSLSVARMSLDGEGLRVVECRALALFNLARHQEAIGLLEETLVETAARGEEWIPAPILSAAVVEVRRSRGQLPAAWELLRPALEAAPRHPLLQSLELAVRAELEDEKELLEEMARRLDGGGAVAPQLRLHLAERFIRRSDPERASELLGSEPPRESALLHPWYRVRVEADAATGDYRRLAETCRGWTAAGGDPDEILAQHAGALSIYGLNDPQLPTLLMLQKAAALGDRLEDRQLYRKVYVRLIGTWAYLGEFDRALELYEKEAESLALDEYFDPEDLRRSGQQARLGTQRLLASVGTLRFQIPAAAVGGRLAVSPQPDEPVDADYEFFDLPAAGPLEVRRRLGKAAQHWVLFDAESQSRGSGTIWPAAGAVVDVLIEIREPEPTASRAARGASEARASRSPGDGRRRVVVTVLDCADWRLIQYLRTRGDLPLLDDLLDTGFRAVLDSDPPNTAAAMEALVYPTRGDSPSFLGLIRQVGDELAGLTFVGDNPFDGLSWVVPDSASLFSVVGEAEHVTLNLLFSRGTVDAGRHGEMVGPRGRVRQFLQWKPQRPLNESERELFPELRIENLGGKVWLVREAAADMDATLSAVRDGEVDLLVMRVASLDIVTHSSFGSITRAGQDDGSGPLYELYRYLDYRLAELERELDSDDILIVMSDHGIKTALQHDRQAFFVAAGPAVPTGRATGVPSFRGVPRMLAALLGIETPWPSSAVESWLAYLPEEASASPAPGVAAP